MRMHQHQNHQPPNQTPSHAVRAVPGSSLPRAQWASARATRSRNSPSKTSFPWTTLCKIDPDMLKSELPEMAGFLQADRATAATQLHRESTQMADVLLEHALAHQIPVLVDGSLRDVHFYERLFDRIHRDFSAYRIAILHVTADRDVIVERAEQRAQRTGRVVPRELLEESMRQVPESVAKLAPRADAVYRIANNEGRPLELVMMRVKDQKNKKNVDDDDQSNEKPTWEEFAQSWKDEEEEAIEEGGEEEATTTTTAMTEPSSLSSSNRRRTTIAVPRIELPVVQMEQVFDCAEQHAAASRIWSAAYPNFCPRCALACDGQCGVCVHGEHLCACRVCNANATCNAVEEEDVATDDPKSSSSRRSSVPWW